MFGEGSQVMRIHLPATAASQSGQATGPGQVVYQGAGATSVAQSNSTGLTIATVAPSAGAGQQRFAYQFDLPDGAVLAKQADGSVTIQNDDGDAAATILAPWATDGSGRSLPTSYAIDATTLTQTIDTSTAVGNVIADPHVVPNAGNMTVIPPSVELPYVTLWLSRRETEYIYRNSDGVTNLTKAIAAICSLSGVVSNVAPPVKAVIVVVCAAANLYASDLTTNLKQAHDRRKCLTANVKPPGFNPLNPLSALNLIKNLATGKLPFLDFDDHGGPDCRP